MGISLGRGEDDMLQTNISRIDVDATIPDRGSIFFLKAICHLFNIRENGNKDEAFESNEMAEKGFTHLLGVIISEIKGKPFTDIIGVSKG
jgi:hypothetical protein